MFAVHPRVSRLLPAALLGLACIPCCLSVAHAAAPVSLRYRFTSGQVLTYRITGQEEVRTVVPGKPVDVTRGTDTVLAHYIVRHVDRGGAATLTISLAQPHRTVDHNGKITQSTPPVASMTTPTDACLQEADGTQYCTYRGAYGQNDLGQVIGGPVSIGASWTSRIDNTWDVNPRPPVTIINTLQRITTTAQGRVAEIASTGHVDGPAHDTGGGTTYTSVLHGTINGTWQFAVDSGTFLSEQLQETGDSTGTVKDKHGSHSMAQHFTSVTTMQLISRQTSAPHPFSPPGPTKSYASATWGYTVTYPASWQGATKAPFDFQALTPDGNAGLFVLAAAAAPTVDAAYVQRLLRLFGTLEGAPTVHIRMSAGLQSVTGDALLVTKSHLEMQCEVRATTTARGLLVFLGLASTGKDDGSLRFRAFARQWEQVQQTLDGLAVAV